MRKSILKVGHTTYSDEILLFAISSAESDLHICLTLNRTLGINLSLTESLEVTIKKTIVPFRKYSYEEDEGIEKYNLFMNRNGSSYLMPELKKFDYILMVQSEGSLKGIENRITQLKSLQEFTAIYKLDHNSIKSFDRLIF